MASAREGIAVDVGAEGPRSVVRTSAILEKASGSVENLTTAPHSLASTCALFAPADNPAVKTSEVPAGMEGGIDGTGVPMARGSASIRCRLAGSSRVFGRSLTLGWST
eukprot:796591-Prymnesium_polylepis.1